MLKILKMYLFTYLLMIIFWFYLLLTMTLTFFRAAQNLETFVYLVEGITLCGIIDHGKCSVIMASYVGKA